MTPKLVFIYILLEVKEAKVEEEEKEAQVVVDKVAKMPLNTQMARMEVQVMQEEAEEEEEMEEKVEMVEI